jgi:excinuclease ABC subunit C
MSNLLIQSKIRHLPERPGVYLMKDDAGEVLYVGKAKSLRARVRSYFTAAPQESYKTRELVRRIADLETIVVGSEAEALILENNLIKEHKPRFNINLRDDKTYPYIKVTVADRFPRVYVTRRLIRDGSRYFGPYTDVRRMRQALELIKKLYTVRSCRYDLPADAPARACLDYHIGRCKAPCIGLQSGEEYGGMIQEILEILSGHTRRATARLRTEMNEAAAALEFERAAELRDAVNQLEALESRQQVVDIEGADRDIVGLARDGAEACGVILRVREGKLLGRETLFLSNLEGEEDQAILSMFVTRIYNTHVAGDRDNVPPEILFPQEFDDRPLIESILRDRTESAVRTHVPVRGDKLRLMELARQNARHLLEERKLLALAAETRAPDALYELQAILELAVVPRMIVGFDISHTQGSETVASAVVFENGEPKKSEYRKFAITGDWGNDDFRSMHEVVTRYFRRRQEEEKELPDLVLIDGGKGQLSAARRALEEIGLPQQPVVSLAKRDEELFVPWNPNSIRAPRRSSALRLVQRVRDEAHRFAVTYNRKLRTKRTVRSELSAIPGIGAARQRTLLGEFGSVRSLRGATEEQLARLPGFSKKLARAVLAHVRESDPPGATPQEMSPA